MSTRQKGKPRGRNGGRKSKPDEQKRQRLVSYISPEIRRWIEERPEPSGQLIDRALLEMFGAEIEERVEPPDRF